MVDLGSWRGSGDAIADWLNHRLHDGRYDYLDFYMGTQLVCHRADLTPVYRMIFTRMREAALDWRYTFPRMYLFRFTRTEHESGENASADDGDDDTAESNDDSLIAAQFESPCRK